MFGKLIEIDFIFNLHCNKTNIFENQISTINVIISLKRRKVTWKFTRIFCYIKQISIIRKQKKKQSSYASEQIFKQKRIHHCYYITRASRHDTHTILFNRTVFMKTTRHK